MHDSLLQQCRGSPFSASGSQGSNVSRQVGDGGGGQPGWVVLASFAAQIAISVLIGVVLGYAMDWTVRMTAALHAKFRLHGGGSMASTGDRRSIQREEAISGNLG